MNFQSLKNIFINPYFTMILIIIDHAGIVLKLARSI